jgi:uncharacterized flavoprotein (TIGR03862 family)
MKKTVAIIGGGPAGMMLASELSKEKFDITIYEKNQALGRKFLVAGKGGFNLTHSEPLEDLKTRYIANQTILNSLDHFTNEDTRNWLNEIGIETFIGSSQRIFPINIIKPIRVLNAILKKIEDNNVTIKTDHEWTGFDKNGLVFETPESDIATIKADIYVFCLGGGSWKVTGSLGEWIEYFKEKEVETLPFQPSNCGFEVIWKKKFIDEYEGTPLKNIAVTHNGKTKKGELVLTQFGIEGGAIYAHSHSIREELNKGNEPVVYLDLKPTTKPEAIERKLKNSRKRKSWSDHVKWQLKLDKVTFALLKRAMDKDDFLEGSKIAEAIKSIPVTITNIASLDEAISTVGGISLDAINENYELKKIPNNYVVGEMLDWDAPTGGYLLQANFSMGMHLAHILNEKK